MKFGLSFVGITSETFITVESLDSKFYFNHSFPSIILILKVYNIDDLTLTYNMVCVITTCVYKIFKFHQISIK